VADNDPQIVEKDFGATLNITHKELGECLESDESQSRPPRGATPS
jgi:hypothetical protein